MQVESTSSHPERFRYLLFRVGHDWVSLPLRRYLYCTLGKARRCPYYAGTKVSPVGQAFEPDWDAPVRLESLTYFLAGDQSGGYLNNGWNNLICPAWTASISETQTWYNGM